MKNPHNAHVILHWYLFGPGAEWIKTIQARLTETPEEIAYRLASLTSRTRIGIIRLIAALPE